jgi:cytidine deaminase
VRSRANGCSDVPPLTYGRSGTCSAAGDWWQVRVHQATWIAVDREVPVATTLHEHHLDGLTTAWRSSGVRETALPWETVSNASLRDDELIRRAAATLNPHRGPSDRHFGGVASCLVTASGNLFMGVDIDTGSGTGFCAEHSAIAAMVTAGEYEIAKIVAVWRDDQGRLYVLPPCGRCRELIRQIDFANLDTEVILGVDRRQRLRELLPEHAWPEPLDPA